MHNQAAATLHPLHHLEAAGSPAHAAAAAAAAAAAIKRLLQAVHLHSVAAVLLQRQSAAGACGCGRGSRWGWRVGESGAAISKHASRLSVSSSQAAHSRLPCCTALHHPLPHGPTSPTHATPPPTGAVLQQVLHARLLSHHIRIPLHPRIQRSQARQRRVQRPHAPAREAGVYGWMVRVGKTADRHPWDFLTAVFLTQLQHRLLPSPPTWLCGPRFCCRRARCPGPSSRRG